MPGFRRRSLVSSFGAALSVWPMMTLALRVASPHRIGVLTTANPRTATFYQAFEKRLRELDYVVNDNIFVDFKSADGNVDRLPELAGALVREGPLLIIRQRPTRLATHLRRRQI